MGAEVVIGWCLALAWFCVIGWLGARTIFTREGRRDLRQGTPLQFVCFVLLAGGPLVFLISLLVPPLWAIQFFGWPLGLWGLGSGLIAILLSSIADRQQRH